MRLILDTGLNKADRFRKSFVGVRPIIWCC